MSAELPWLQDPGNSNQNLPHSGKKTFFALNITLERWLSEISESRDRIGEGIDHDDTMLLFFVRNHRELNFFRAF